jgi:uncharacterized protein YhdP
MKVAKKTQDPKEQHAAHVARIQKAAKEITAYAEKIAKVENANWADVCEVQHWSGNLESITDGMYKRGEFE